MTKKSEKQIKSTIRNLIVEAAILFPHMAFAEDIFGLTQTGKLLRFDSAAPETLLSTTAITGLGNSETLVGIDFPPATGESDCQRGKDCISQRVL